MAESIWMPGASYATSQTGVGTAYWDSAYAGLPLTLAYHAPFPIDACLVNLPAGVPGGGDFYDYCSSLPGAVIQENRRTGVLGFTVPSQQDNGFDFDVLSRRGEGFNVSFAWWINSTAGTLARWPWDNLTVPAGQLIESRISKSVSLPAAYDSISVQGWSTYPVELVIDNDL